MKITISLKNIDFFFKDYTKIKHHSIFLTAVHHTKKEVNYSLILVTMLLSGLTDDTVIFFYTVFFILYTVIFSVDSKQYKRLAKIASVYRVNSI